MGHFFNGFFFVTAGIFIGIYFNYALYFALFIAAVSIIILFINRPLALLTLFMATIMLVSANLYNRERRNYKDVTVEGVVESIEAKENYAAVVLKNCNHEEIGKNKVYCYLFSEDAEEIKEGNKLLLTGNAYSVNEKEVFPGETNIHYLGYGTDYRFYADSYEITEETVSIAYHMRLLRERVRQIIFDNVENEDSAAVLYAMVSGDKGNIDGYVKEIFNACGTSHLLAVSGLHVSIFLSLFILLLNKLKIRNIFAFLIICLLVAFYSIFTGFSSSVLRASIMALAVNLSTVTGGRYNSLNSLGFAGTGILLFEPFRVLDISFQLSFLACFGIVFIIKYIPKTRNKILNAVIDSVMISLGATVFTLPLILYYFGEISTVTLIANVMLVSVASFSLALTFIFTMLALLWLPAGMLLHMSGHIMTAIIKITEFLSKAPSFKIRPVSVLLTVIIILLMVFFTRFVRFKRKRKMAGILLIILPLLWINTAVYHNNYAKIYTVKECIHIDDGKNYILGIADEEEIEEQIEYIKRNIGKVDALILLDEEDMLLLETAIEKGLKFDKLYGVKYMKGNEASKKYNFTVIAKLNTPKGYFDFQQAPKYFCGENCIKINEIQATEYSRKNVRSR